MASDLDLPIDILFIRHGHSEANVVVEMLQRGDNSGREALAAAQRHDSAVRLTDLGRKQAKAVGDWIKSNVGRLDRHFVSQYTRTKETAAVMGLPEARWTLDVLIRERDQGVNEGNGSARMGLDESEMKRQKRSQMYWSPPGGESVADVYTRARLFLRRLQAECSGMRVVVVCHHQVMQAFRLLLEDRPQHEYEALLAQSLPNGCILWYSRRDASGEVRSRLAGGKLITVGLGGEESEVVAIDVRRQHFTNEQLLSQIEVDTPQLINNDGVVFRPKL